MSQTTTLTLSATRGEAELEAQLALMTAAIARCFERMEEEDRTEYGTLRRDECGNAERLLALSSGIGLALAKIKGKFEHQINVLRGPADAPPALARAQEGALVEAPAPTPLAK